MTEWLGVLGGLIICLPLLLAKVIKDESQKSTYVIGYVIGVLITVKIIEWFS